MAVRGQRKLTAEAIAAAALELADAEGVDALSMRHLANKLGVGTMSLYGYFRTKGDLLDAMLDVAASERPRGRLSGDWRNQLRELITRAHRNLARHPSVVEVRLRRPLLSPQQLRVNERGVSILLTAGLSTLESARAFRTLFFYLFGFAALSGDDDETRTRTRQAIAALPPDSHPALHAAQAEIVEVAGGKAQFEYGLDLLLDGIAVQVDQAQRKRDATGVRAAAGSRVKGSARPSR